MTNATNTMSPGVRLSQIFKNLDDSQAERLLPSGAFKLISTIYPELLKGPQRAETLGKVLSLEIAVDDSQKREILLNAVPLNKVAELEDRVGDGD